MLPDPRLINALSQITKDREPLAFDDRALESCARCRNASILYVLDDALSSLHSAQQVLNLSNDVGC
jgi:hypothetical protein